MIHRLCLVLLTLFLCSCAITQPPIPKPNDDTFVKVRLLSAKAGGKEWEALLTFEEWTEYEWVVQEIIFDNGRTIVECFQTPNGRLFVGQRDRHWETQPWPSSWRYMFVYPATVDGADTTPFGFAMLPENRDGSVKTTTGTAFNEGYRSRHEVRGRVVADAKHLGIVWTINYTKGKLTVTLPNDLITHYYDPEHYQEEPDGN